MEQVRTWYAMEEASGAKVYRVEVQHMYTVRNIGKKWACSCGKKNCRHILSAQGARV